MSGVSLVDMINNLLINIFAAIAAGDAVVISQYLGNRDRNRASRAATQLITVALVISAGFILFWLFLMPVQLFTDPWEMQRLP